MKRTDSGSATSISTASTSGTMPPKISRLRQPKWGISQAAKKPPKAEPTGNPQNMQLVMKDRLLSGQYSFISVTALGIAAPRPRPVMKRQIVSDVNEPELADTREAAPMITTATVRTLLRPKRSASGPALSAPKASPNSAALSTGPRSP